MKGWPVVLSLTLLVLSVSAFAWASSFALVLVLPRPAEEQVTLAEIEGVLTGTGGRAENDVELAVEQEPPVARPKTPLQAMIARSLEKTTGSSEVRIEFQAFSISGERNRVPSLDAALAKRTLAFTQLTVAARKLDDSWVVVRQNSPLITSWHLQIFAAFCAFALLLIPCAFLVARRLSAPMRRLSVWLAHADVEGSSAGLPEGGPRELRQVAAAIVEMRRRLRMQVEERTTMLAAVAHDLRTPLTALRVRTEAAPPVVRDRMIEDIGRLEQMISQFLQYVGGASAEASFVDLDLTEVAGNAIQASAHVCLLPSPCLPILGNPLDLGRMLANLVDNAVRSGGRAIVKLEEEGGFAIVRVQDDGPGISEHELERVLQPFYRTDESRNSDTGGTGLGLAIVQAVAQANHGNVALRNRKPRGLEAIVRLPLRRAGRGAAQVAT